MSASLSQTVQLLTYPLRTANEKGIAFVQILIIAVTLVVVAVPEGQLPSRSILIYITELPPAIQVSHSPSH